MDTVIQPAGTPAAAEPISAMAFLLDSDSEGVIRRSFGDLGFSNSYVARGNIATAVEEVGRRGSPRLLVIDVSDIADPMMQINRLAELCDPKTEVIVVGDRNDVVLYRDLKTAGVAEYFFKPLVSRLVSRVLAEASSGNLAAPLGRRTGKLVTVLGVRGGVGTTTIAANAAWYVAEARERRVILLDLDLQAGDAALQLDTKPSHALREALDHPERIDELFLDRGVARVTPRLGLLASLEGLDGRLALDQEAVLSLLDKLLAHYRYVFIDLPDDAAVGLLGLLHLPGSLLLVSTGTLSSARDVVRWREKIGPNTPERSLLHLLNKSGAEDALIEKELHRMLGQPPDIVIPDSREIAAAANLGTKEIQKCSAMRRGMADVARQIAGAALVDDRSWWKRIWH